MMTNNVSWYQLKPKKIISGVTSIGLHFALKLLSINACSNLGAFMARTASHFYPNMDKNLRKNISYLLPDISKSDSDVLIRKWWENHGRILSEFSVYKRIQKKNNRIALSGIDHFESAKKLQRPIIFLCVHLANWEHIGPELLKIANNQIVQIYQDVGYFKMLIANHTRRCYQKLLIKGDHSAGLKAYRKLLEGYHLLLAIDEDYKNNDRFPVFGMDLPKRGNISFALRLAKMTNAVLLPVYIKRKEKAFFSLHFTPPIIHELSTFNDQEMKAVMQEIDIQISKIIKSNLDQWYYLPHRVFNKNTENDK